MGSLRTGAVKDGRSRYSRRIPRLGLLIGLWAGALLTIVADPAQAHVGGFSGTVGDQTVPTWLTIGTGGVIIGASFLFATLMSDRAAIERINAAAITIPLPSRGTAWLGVAAGLASAGGFALILHAAFFGAPERTNLAILAIWTGWWAGYTMTTYTIGNTWPGLNPWRAVARALPTRATGIGREVGTRVSIIGLLGLVWLEVVSPVASDPRLLGGVVLGYSGVTLVGAAIVGPDPWFTTVDPVARVFRAYGWIAPVQRTANGLELRLPGGVIAEDAEAPPPGTEGFVVALLWVTTYDGLVATPAWAAAIRPLVESGVPPRAIYLLTIVAGYGGFLGVYRLAATRARTTADTYVTGRFVARWFSTALLPIAAGYHVAHFLGYFLTLSPSLLAALTRPLGGIESLTLAVLPGWFGLLPLTFVLLGHVLAVWIAHGRAVTLFPGILQPIRSQYPFIFVMIVYTLVSLWVVTQPFTPPPYL